MPSTTTVQTSPAAARILRSVRRLAAALEAPQDTQEQLDRVEGVIYRWRKDAMDALGNAGYETLVEVAGGEGCQLHSQAWDEAAEASEHPSALIEEAIAALRGWAYAADHHQSPDKCEGVAALITELRRLRVDRSPANLRAWADELAAWSQAKMERHTDWSSDCVMLGIPFDDHELVGLEMEALGATWRCVRGTLCAILTVRLPLNDEPYLRVNLVNAVDNATEEEDLWWARRD